VVVCESGVTGSRVLVLMSGSWADIYGDGSVEIYHEIIGQGPNKLIVLQGFICTVKTWGPPLTQFFRSLSPDWTICLMDHRNLGQSRAKPASYTTTLMAHDIIALIRHLNWHSPDIRVHLAGLSMGGFIASEAAVMLLDQRKLGSLLILVSGNRLWPLQLKVPYKLIEWLVKLDRRVFHREMSIDRVIWLTFSQKYLNQSPPDEQYRIKYPEAKTNYDAVYREFDENFNHYFDMRIDSMSSHICALLSHRLSESKMYKLRNSEAAITCMISTNDKLIVPYYQYRLANGLHADTMVFGDSGHFGFLEKHPKVVLAFQSHLKRALEIQHPNFVAPTESWSHLIWSSIRAAWVMLLDVVTEAYVWHQRSNKIWWGLFLLLFWEVGKRIWLHVMKALKVWELLVAIRRYSSV
jgi:pimeloyl-ACP methyl ester carboxylesterase